MSKWHGSTDYAETAVAALSDVAAMSGSNSWKTWSRDYIKEVAGQLEQLAAVATRMARTMNDTLECIHVGVFADNESTWKYCYQCGRDVPNEEL